jgi:hypothetical protein
VIPAERTLREARGIVAAASLLARAGFTIRQVRPARRSTEKNRSMGGRTRVLQIEDGDLDDL